MEKVQTEIDITSVIEQPSGFAFIAQADVPVGDENYIEGAIQMWVGDEPVLTSSHWDLIDQLWDYIVDARAQIEQGQPFHTYFPDQPTSLEIAPEAGGLRVTSTCDAGTWTALADRDIFVKQLWSAAREFYQHLPTVAPGMKTHCEEQLNALSRG